MTDIKALVDRLRFIANHTHEVMAEEIEEVCDAAADALAPLAGPVGMPEEPKEFVQVRASKAQTYFQEVAIAYIDVLRAHAEQLQQQLDAALAAVRDAKRSWWNLKHAKKWDTKHADIIKIAKEKK